MARQLGSLASDLPWFPFAYIFTVFGLLPIILFLLSLAGLGVLIAIGLPLLMAFAFLITVIALRKTRPNVLPAVFTRDPRWMPPSLRMDGEGVEEEKAPEGVGNADLGRETLWWQAPATWGMGWIAILLLLLAVPNPSMGT
jgi:hypothetical protein